MSTPKEVFSAMAADFRKRNLSYEDVANLTGYKKQTIANFIASRKDYLSQGQAARFAQAFEYNMEYLTSGKGRLDREDDIAWSLNEGKGSGSDSRKLVALMDMLSRYLCIVDDPTLLALYRNMLNLINEADVKKAYGYIRNQEKIFDLLAREHGVESEFPVSDADC